MDGTTYQSDIVCVVLVMLGIGVVLLDRWLSRRGTAVAPMKPGDIQVDYTHAQKVHDALERALNRGHVEHPVDITIASIEAIEPRWLEDFDTELYTAEDARAHRDALLAESKRAADETSRHREALLKVGGIRRKAMHVYAEMSACRARRTKMWADHFDDIAEELENVPHEDKMGEVVTTTQPPAPPAEGTSNG